MAVLEKKKINEEEEVVVAHKLDIKEEILSYVKIALVCLAIVLFIKFVTPLYTVNGSSMNKTLYDGEICIGCTLIPPSKGKIVTFKNKTQTFNDTYIKRVIAGPGDTVKIKNHIVYVNGEKLEEKYVYFAEDGGRTSDLSDVKEFKLEKKQYFVCGDNRYNSSDSRYFGPVLKKDISSVVIITLDTRWFMSPIRRWLGLESTLD